MTTQDESRFGLKTLARRRIALKGVKPSIQAQWQFDAFYLYGVVEPSTGEVMIEDYHRANAENFQQFLDDFSERHPEDFHVVQADNASFHRSKSLVMSDNAMILYQPPHGPQVNSCEQLLDWAKDEIANRVFPSLDALKLTLKELFSSKQKAFFSSLTSRGFIRDPLQKIGMVPAIT